MRRRRGWGGVLVEVRSRLAPPRQALQWRGLLHPRRCVAQGLAARLRPYNAAPGCSAARRSGPIQLARSLGLPIVPLAARATREIRLPTWDRLRIPVPRAHIAVAFGEPLWPDARDQETVRRDLARRLHDLGARATREAGRRDSYPAPRHLSWLDNPKIAQSS